MGQRVLLSAKYGTFSEPGDHNYQKFATLWIICCGYDKNNVIYDTGSSNLKVSNSEFLWMVLKSQFLPRKQIRHLLEANGSIFKIKYGSGTVSDFSSKNTMNIGGMSITDYTFAEVSDVSGQE